MRLVVNGSDPITEATTLSQLVGSLGHMESDNCSRRQR